jgi:two-component system LytT family response regulator
MTKIRTLIIDDEPLARRKLSRLLSCEPDFELVGECADGSAALHAIREQRPGLLFLDVQMPGLTGFQVLQSLEGPGSPAVVFVTAHDQFAVRAFEAQAIDYLLKPFRRDRFQCTLQRIRMALAARASQPPPVVTPLPEQLVVKSRDRFVFVRLDQLDYVRAAANYVHLHVGSDRYEVRGRIGDLQAQLPTERFVRVHRSYIVNLNAVHELFPAGGGEYMVTMRSGRQLPVGPTYPPLIREALTNARILQFGGGSQVGNRTPSL